MEQRVSLRTTHCDPFLQTFPKFLLGVDLY